MSKKIIILVALAYIILFCIFLPQFTITSDDQEYARSAMLFKQGKICVPEKEHAYSFVWNGRCYISPEFLGMALFLVPFSIFGFWALFLSGMVVHLIGTFVFYRFMKLLKQPTYYTLLYLLFPPFIYYSTLISDNYLAGVLLMAGFYFYCRDRYAMAGVLFGLTCAVRYDAVIVVGIFYFYTLINYPKKIYSMVAGFLPFALFILLFDKIA